MPKETENTNAETPWEFCNSLRYGYDDDTEFSQIDFNDEDFTEVDD